LTLAARRVTLVEVRRRGAVATPVGRAAAAVAAQFEQWRSAPDPAAADRFCVALREHALELPVVYFAERLDRWLMGDQVPGPGKVEGRRFQATTFSAEEALAWAERCGTQFPEQEWFASRLREAAAGWGNVAERYIVVLLREVTGPQQPTTRCATP
jgi:hypothetical protein